MTTTEPLADLVAQLRELEWKATPGPWKDTEFADVYGVGNDEICDCDKANNAALIAAMRNALPRLLNVAVDFEAMRLDRDGFQKERGELEQECKRIAAQRDQLEDECGRLRFRLGEGVKWRNAATGQVTDIETARENERLGDIANALRTAEDAINQRDEAHAEVEKALATAREAVEQRDQARRESAALRAKLRERETVAPDDEPDHLFDTIDALVAPVRHSTEPLTSCVKRLVDCALAINRIRGEVGADPNLGMPDIIGKVQILKRRLATAVRESDDLLTGIQFHCAEFIEGDGPWNRRQTLDGLQRMSDAASGTRTPQGDTAQNARRPGTISYRDDVQGGVPCLDGTRIPFFTFWSMFARGFSNSKIIELYPHLEQEDIEICRRLWHHAVICGGDYDRSEDSEPSESAADPELREWVAAFAVELSENGYPVSESARRLLERIRGAG